MTFVKVVKNKAYFKRFQVKFRRRREAKTDYYARKRLVVQDMNKYATAKDTKKLYMVPKFRFVVRFTNSQVICQVVRAEVDHDVVVACAYSSELTADRYGLKVGLKNYAAAYCTGLLCARRLLQKFKLDSDYQGNTEVNGEVVSTTDFTDGGREKEYFVAEVAERRPFRAYLDVGLAATTTGARVFGALKGAADGGLDIPHSEKRFPGYDREAKEYAPEAHRARIFGEHVGDYMTEMQAEEPEKYAAHFSQYIKNGISADDLEAMYEKVHANIRADPSPAAKKTAQPDKRYKKASKLSYDERKQRVAEKRAKRVEELRAMLQ